MQTAIRTLLTSKDGKQVFDILNELEGIRHRSLSSTPRGEQTPLLSTMLRQGWIYELNHGLAANLDAPDIPQALFDLKQAYPENYIVKEISIIYYSILGIHAAVRDHEENIETPPATPTPKESDCCCSIS